MKLLECRLNAIKWYINFSLCACVPAASIKISWTILMISQKPKWCTITRHHIEGSVFWDLRKGYLYLTRPFSLVSWSRFFLWSCDAVFQYTMHNKLSNSFVWVSPSTSDLEFHLLLWRYKRRSSDKIFHLKKYRITKRSSRAKVTFNFKTSG